MSLPRDEILKQVSEAIDAAEERATEIEREARERAETILADARTEAKRILDRAQSAVAGLAAEIGGEVPEPEPTPLPGPTPEEPPPAAAGGDGADVGARLVALKMALDGAARDEVEGALEKKYGAADRAELLDDVFARAGR